MFPESPGFGGMVFPIVWLDEEGYAPLTFNDKPLEQLIGFHERYLILHGSAHKDNDFYFCLLLFPRPEVFFSKAGGRPMLNAPKQGHF